MSAGPFVFGPNRVGLWVIENDSLVDKLKSVLPHARSVIPNLTDIFLPLSATLAAKDVVRQNNFFAHLYVVAHSTPAVDLAKQAVARRRDLGTGAIEVDLEGAAVQPDKPALAAYARAFVGQVRKTNPNLPVRLNVPPFKGYALPLDLILSDPLLYVIAQAYYGNMEGRLTEDAVLLDLIGPPGVGWGLPLEKVKIHYPVKAGLDPNNRDFVAPGWTYKPVTQGSYYSDDLLIDSGRMS